MAYDRDKILKNALAAIEAEKLCFFDEIALFVEPTLSTLYEWEFEKSEEIKSALAKNKIEAKRKLKRNWQKEDAAPALQVAVYKLMANDEEFNRLTTAKNDVKADVKGGVNIIITPLEGCEPINEDNP